MTGSEFWERYRDALLGEFIKGVVQAAFIFPLALLFGWAAQSWLDGLLTADISYWDAVLIVWVGLLAIT